MKLKQEFRLRSLGELCHVTGGNSAPQGEEFFKNGTVPFVRMRDLGGYHHTTQLDKTRDLVTPVAIQKKGLKIFEPGCILFPRSGSVALNHRAILAIRACIVSHIGILQQLSEEIDTRYLYWFLVRYDMGEIAKQTTGLDLVNFSDVKKISIPLPPTIEDQHKIVAEIERQFTRLDAGVSALRRVQTNLKRYRAAVLKAACEGKLVENEVQKAKAEGRTAETGEELLKRILVERRRNWNGRGKYKEPAAPDTANVPGLPRGWTWSTVDMIGFVTKLAGFEYTKFVRYDPDGDLAVIKAENASRAGFKRTGFSRVKGSTVAQLTRSQLQAGDLLMVFVGAGTGNVARVPDDQAYFLGPNIGMIRIQCHDVSPAYVELFLRSPVGNSLALRFAKAVAQPSLSMGTIRMIPVAIPPLAEQERIVAEVERRLSVVEELEAVVSANLRRATRLRHSILQKAFSGELVPQEQPAVADKVIPLPIVEHHRHPNRHFARALLSAEIVHQLHSEPTFGRVKHQKIFHLCEHIAGIEEIEGEYHREAAGPLDNTLIYANEAELKKQKWFKTVERGEYGHAYETMEKAGGHRKYLEQYWPEKLPVVEKLIKLMRIWDTDRCEIFSTTYAAWNDLILWGKPATEENILHEILERWHPKKKRFPKERWLKAIAWMKENGFAPAGFGKPTRNPE